MSGRLITTREVAELLGVSTETVLRWHRAGRLRGYRLAAGVLRFREDELEAWIEQCQSSGRSIRLHPTTKGA